MCVCAGVCMYVHVYASFYMLLHACACDSVSVEKKKNKWEGEKETEWTEWAWACVCRQCFSWWMCVCESVLYNTWLSLQWQKWSVLRQTASYTHGATCRQYLPHLFSKTLTFSLPPYRLSCFSHAVLPILSVTGKAKVQLQFFYFGSVQMA